MRQRTGSVADYVAAVGYGLVGVLGLTIVGYGAPLLGAARFDVMRHFGGRVTADPAAAMGFGEAVVLGGYGGVAAVAYAALVPRLPGAAWARGALWGVVLWAAAAALLAVPAQQPVGGWDVATTVTALVAHLAYGAVLGALYGLPRRRW
jgi:hypothetical protein